MLENKETNEVEKEEIVESTSTEKIESVQETRKILTHPEMLDYYLKMLFLFHKQVNEDSLQIAPELTHEFTDEKDITITAYDLGIKVLEYKYGKNYASALSIVGAHLERNGLMKTQRNEEGIVVVNIPDWNLFITAIDLYYKLLGPFTKR